MRILDLSQVAMNPELDVPPNEYILPSATTTPGEDLEMIEGLENCRSSIEGSRNVTFDDGFVYRFLPPIKYINPSTVTARDQ